jgi:hypothetical protein
MPCDEGVLARWSRRKAQERSGSGSREQAPSREPEPESSSAHESAAEPAPDLDCASLEFSSDFSRFVHAGISDIVQTAALRRLWQTSPLFGASDGLDVYRADYAGALPARDLPAAASRALAMVAVEQSTAEQCAPGRGASLAVSSRPQKEIAPGAQQEQQKDKLFLPEAQEPQPSD